MTAFIAWTLLGIVAILVLWWIRHQAILDPLRKQVLWDKHSIWHLVVPGAYMAIGALLFRFEAGGVVPGALLIALAWETANWRPHTVDGGIGRGTFEFSDLFYGVIGGFAFALLVELLR